MDKDKPGAFAPFAVVEQSPVAKMPAALRFTDAAGLPLAGLTALPALRDELGPQAGDRVFISGGAGGVGTLAIQLAVSMGAEVATTASPRGADLVSSLGAKTVIGYREQKFKDVLRDDDGAFDLTGGQDLLDSFAILKPGTTTVSVTKAPEPTTARRDMGKGPLLAAVFGLLSVKIRREARRHGASYRFLFMHPSGADLAHLAALVDAGEPKPVTDRVFPFEQFADGFSCLEQGCAEGQVVVETWACGGRACWRYGAEEPRRDRSGRSKLVHRTCSSRTCSWRTRSLRWSRDPTFHEPDQPAAAAGEACPDP
ncbi:NADP-dependent oxidoreductase [Streptomyces sp. GS7]|uniref:NADP-dependent oxidoreductase n=1 Tax=Streptomyces sp. GS7 TaxID=2692234 RepID=UPI001F1CFE50|nr:NADP-dependent oxidoreductase [Streptomyces sp. GS7]